MQSERQRVAAQARAEGAEQGSGPNEKMMALLDDEGLTSVVATNCEQHYDLSLIHI